MSQLRVPISQGDHIKGSSQARITLVEYGDYECASCRRVVAVLDRVLSCFPSDVRFVYRHFPTSELHPQAVAAAEIAEAAAAQDRFWDMHALLYEQHQALTLGSLLRLGSLLHLDLDRMRAELARHAYLPKIEADFKGGVRSGVWGTPSVFLGDVRYDAPLQVAGIVATIDQMLDSDLAARPPR
ncbi:MAG: Na+/H+ antiporter NhaA [Deltaproteobacteria bacterium]|nr:Na+/H+ antiporter NhaA [Deltaproteobacteria bacterium]